MATAQRCKGCGGDCVIRTSRTAQNPNRDFYACGKRCGKWNGWVGETAAERPAAERPAAERPAAERPAAPCVAAHAIPDSGRITAAAPATPTAPTPQPILASSMARTRGAPARVPRIVVRRYPNACKSAPRCERPECAKQLQDMLRLARGKTGTAAADAMGCGAQYAGYAPQHCELHGCHNIYWKGKHGATCDGCGMEACVSCYCTHGTFQDDGNGQWICPGCCENRCDGVVSRASGENK